MDVVVLTIPRRMTIARECVDNLVSCGFPASRVSILCDNNSDSNNDENGRNTLKDVDDAIFQWHWHAAHVHCTGGATSHLMVVEDDCFIRRHDAYDIVMRVVSRKDLDWHVLLLGHTPLGRCTVVPGHADVVTTHCSVGAHCYVLNRNALDSMLRTISRTDWRKPDAVEVWQCVPIRHRMALRRSIAFQRWMPREVCRLPVVGPLLKHVSYEFAAKFMETVMLAVGQLLSKTRGD